MADTLVERLTGQAEAGDLDIEVQITIPLDTLLDPDEPADPAATDRRIDLRRRSGQRVGESGRLRAVAGRSGPRDHRSSRGRKWWRRLFTGPTGQLIGGDPTRRRFDGWLAKLIGLRDQTCRDPFCDAPIRHFDHIHRWSDGGLTTLRNGRGTCARGNLIREMPGWQVHLVHSGHVEAAHRPGDHPTGHTYVSRAPDPP